ncbi:hypothetical protein VH569_33285 [Azospirillum sp. 11R-A]|uniref:hypothetical protein n=1 Tax=Azospirillum sp. 11R-A TaxID=3111634 RepID=UPI003C176583
MLTFDDCLALTDLAPDRLPLVDGMGTVSAFLLMSDSAAADAGCSQDPGEETQP